jgi:glutathione synthase/RimK-type ligase-like ATP-grasp enzyme
MKIAIHKAKNTFSEEWIAYCEEKRISYKTVDCYSSTILAEIADCNLLFWHHNHADPRDVLFAKQLLISCEIAGKSVFPEFYSNWHFDDKLGQKYLFEALQIAHVPTHVFFEKQKALDWVDITSFPKVCKLRRGAGSRNVWLVNSKKEAKETISKAFGKGFRQYDAWGGIKESLRKYRLGKTTLKEVIKALAHLIYPIQLEKSQGREKGYVYFQDFIPNNTFDIRVVIIGDKAFAIKRHVRENDFRASGSGFIEYQKELFDESLIAQSFENAAKIKAYCTAFDYVFLDGKPLIVEISYGFNKKGYFDCPGYWNKDLVWHEGSFNPYGWMIDDVLKQHGK